MKMTGKKITIVLAVVFAAVCVLFGWQPIKAATSRISQLIYQTKMASGLIGYWPFELGSTTQNIAMDVSGSGNNGTISGMATSTAQTVGLIGQTLSFDGVNDYVGVNDSFAPTGANSRSISLWFKTSVTPGAATSGLIVYGNTGSVNQQYYILLYNGTDCTGTITSTGGNYGLAAGTGGSGSNVCDNTPVIDGAWHNVVSTYDGATHSIYMDGALRSSRSQTPNTASGGADALHIGEDRGGDYFNGKIDEVRFYNRALSSAEVSYLYNRAGPGGSGKISAPPKAGLVGFWNFDDCDSCSTAADKSGTGNTGTTYNAAGPTVGDLHVTTGKIGNALSFDGINDFVQVADAASLKPTAITISAWVNLNSLTGTTQCGGAPNTLQYLLFKRNTRVAAFEGYVINKYIDGSSNPNFNFSLASSGGTQNGASGKTIVTTGKWYHVVGTFERPNAKLYVNGELDGTATHDFDLDHHTRPFFIGRSGECGGGGETNFDAYSNAKIDEVRIYNRALSDAEVRNLYRDTSKRIINKSSSVLNNGGAVIDLSFDGTNVDWGASSSEIKDTSGTNKDGDASGMTNASNARIGVNGQAIYFDGSDDSITTTYNGPTVAPISFVFWAKPDASNPVGMFDSAPNVGNVLRNYSNGTIEWWSNDPAVNFTLNPNVWQHLVVVFWFDTNRHIDLYVDGILKASATGGTGNVIAWNGLRLGDINNGGAGRYAGALDNFRVFTKKFTAGEAAAIYAQDKHGGR